MRRSAKWMLALGACTATTTALLLSCLKDPREGEAVVVIDKCDTSKLSTDPKSIESTLRTYVEATGALATAVTEADKELAAACIALYKASPALNINAPPDGSPALVACQPLIARIATTNQKQPTAPGLNIIPPWSQFVFGEHCAVPVGMREKCLAGCTDPAEAGACDVSKCEQGKVVGKCPGECLGACTTVAKDDAGVKCAGTCVGEFPVVSVNANGLGGTCVGECVGTCGNGIYTGNCKGSCNGGFTGICAETCHGTCNGNPLTEKTPGRDAGPPNGVPLNGAVDSPPVLNDDPGNCGTGLCVGSCSGGANGSCYSDPTTGKTGRCVAITPDPDGGPYTSKFSQFNSGECTNSICYGTCRSANGSGAAVATINTLAVGTCYGECTQLTKPPRPPAGQPLPSNTACEGTCRPDPNAVAGDGGADAGAFCSTDLDPTTTLCEGKLNCGQNAECNNACEAKAALAEVCDDPYVLQVYATTDPALYDALRANGLAIAKAVSKLHRAATAYSYIGNRNYGDFVALGAKGDLAYACAKQGADAMATAGKLLLDLGSADPTNVKAVAK